MRTKTMLVAGIALLLAAVPILAHHSLASQYDTKKPIKLKGTVTKVSWENPHIHLFLEAKDKKGTEVEWEFELGSPNLQIQNGWKLDTFRRGDHVVVTAYPARDGSKSGYATKVAAGTN